MHSLSQLPPIWHFLWCWSHSPDSHITRVTKVKFHPDTIKITTLNPHQQREWIIKPYPQISNYSHFQRIEIDIDLSAQDWFMYLKFNNKKINWSYPTSKLFSPPCIHITQDLPPYPLLYRASPMCILLCYDIVLKFSALENFVDFLTSLKVKNHHANLFSAKICFFAWSSLKIFNSKNPIISMISKVSRNIKFLGLLLLHVHIYSQSKALTPLDPLLNRDNINMNKEIIWYHNNTIMST